MSRHEHGVVILAGGEGRRIGGDKALRLFAGRTLLDHALDRARAWSRHVAVAVRDPAQTGGAGGVGGAAILVDQGGAGPLEGLRSALEYAEALGLAGVLVVACDIPLAPEDLMGRLVAALGPDTLAAVACSGGRLHPTAGLWRAAALAMLDVHLAAGGASLNGFAERGGAVHVDWPVLPYDPFLNVNDAAELAAAEALFKSR